MGAYVVKCLKPTRLKSSRRGNSDGARTPVLDGVQAAAQEPPRARGDVRETISLAEEQSTHDPDQPPSGVGEWYTRITSPKDSRRYVRVSSIPAAPLDPRRDDSHEDELDVGKIVYADLNAFQSPDSTGDGEPADSHSPVGRVIYGELKDFVEEESGSSSPSSGISTAQVHTPTSGLM